MTGHRAAGAQPREAGALTFGGGVARDAVVQQTPPVDQALAGLVG